MQRRAEGERGTRLMVLSGLPLRTLLLGGANGSKHNVRTRVAKTVAGALAVGAAAVAASAALFERVRLHVAPRQAVNGTGEEQRNGLPGQRLVPSDSKDARSHSQRRCRA